MTPSQQLITRLRDMGHEIPPDAVIRRTYAGAVQRSEGAWSWFLISPSNSMRLDFGSHWPVWLLLRHQITVSQDANWSQSYSIDPVHAEQNAAFAELRERKAADDARATSVTLRRIRSRR